VDRGPRRPDERRGDRRQGGFDPGRRDQHGHRAGRGGRAFRLRSDRLEDHVRAEDDRPPRARPEQGSPRPGDAERQGDHRRLRRYAARFRAGRRRERVGPVPRHARDLDGVGRGGRRHHRDRAPGARRRRGTVRPAMNDFVIEADGLTKRYDGAVAVDHVSFQVSRGEIFGLPRPDGAGETTPILMLLGLTDLTEGEARVLGHDPEREPLAVKRRVGYLPDSVGFYDHLTAAENLRYTARLMGMSEAERDTRIAAALARVELTEVADHRVGTFSRGMRQRLGVAEILMKQAAVAILDEPTSGLDPQATLELLEMIRALKREGVSVLLSSHLLDRVQSVCDRVALFQSGKIALIGSVAELGRQVLGGGFAVEV